MTQERLARLAECSTSIVRMYEAGFAPAHSPTRARVERVLDQLEAEKQSEAA